MIISLKVRLICTQVYCQGQLDTADIREATCHLKWRKPLKVFQRRYLSYQAVCFQSWEKKIFKYFECRFCCIDQVVWSLACMSFHWACVKIHWLNLEDMREQLMLFSASKYTYEIDETVSSRQDLFICGRWAVSTPSGTMPCKDTRDLGGQHQEFCLGQRIFEK